MVFSRVHAMFSHLEGYLRNGDLLPGPARHRFSTDQPAYELPTGHADTRVLARRMKNARKWLLTAWAADGRERRVTVPVPGLGKVTLLARPEGIVHCATRAGKAPQIRLVPPEGRRQT